MRRPRVGRSRSVYDVEKLPYRARVYVNNQVLIPASLVRALGLGRYWYADVVIRFNGNVIEIKRVRLLRTRRTDSRQFTIPREVREKHGIRIFDEVEILKIKPVERSFNCSATLHGSSTMPKPWQHCSYRLLGPIRTLNLLSTNSASLRLRKFLTRNLDTKTAVSPALNHPRYCKHMDSHDRRISDVSHY